MNSAAPHLDATAICCSYQSIMSDMSKVIVLRGFSDECLWSITEREAEAKLLDELINVGPTGCSFS